MTLQTKIRVLQSSLRALSLVQESATNKKYTQTQLDVIRDCAERVQCIIDSDSIAYAPSSALFHVPTMLEDAAIVGERDRTLCVRLFLHILCMLGCAHTEHVKLDQLEQAQEQHDTRFDDALERARMEEENEARHATTETVGEVGLLQLSTVS